MKIIDLTEAYVRRVLGEDDRAAYERSHPALFRHYFEYWADRRRFTPTLDEADLRIRTATVTEVIHRLSPRLTARGWDVTGLRIILFVGQGTSNGHAFRDGDSYAVWIPVETYQSVLGTEVFVTHEIAHAMHYRLMPDFFFTTRAEKLLVSRQLITEGLATYLSSQALKLEIGAALWADYLPPQALQKWLSECRSSEQDLKRFVLENFASDDPRLGLFYARDPRDVFQFRGGYYVGLRFLKELVRRRRLTAGELLRLPRPQFERFALEYLTGC